MGMLIFFARSALGDCTMNGVSSQHKGAVVVNVEGPFQPSTEHPALLLENHFQDYLRLVPAVCVNGKWVATPSTMFGGNFGYTSDIRFVRACEELLGYQYSGAVPVHDRIES